MITGPLVSFPRHPLVLARFGLPALAKASTFGRRAFKTEQARALFAGCAAHAFLPLDHLLTTSFGLVLMAAGNAVGWPVAAGGSQAIADALAAYLRELGGEIRTGEAVSALDQLPDSRAVLFDLSPSMVAAIAGDELPASYRGRLDRFRHGPAAFKIDYALSGPVPWTYEPARRAGTVHVCGTAAEVEASEAATASGQHAERPLVLVAQQSLADPSRAPAGRHTLWAYCHVPNGSTIDMTERIEAQIERFAPGFRDLVLARHVAGPSWFEAYNANYVGGDIAGGSHQAMQLIFRPTVRFRPYRTPNPRLFLCSASTPPGARRPRHVWPPRRQRRAPNRGQVKGRPDAPERSRGSRLRSRLGSAGRANRLQPVDGDETAPDSAHRGSTERVASASRARRSPSITPAP